MLLNNEPKSIAYDLDIERQVIGILIRHPERIDHVIDKIKPVHFFDSQNRKVYQIILDLYNKQGKISYTRIYFELRKDSKIDPEEILTGYLDSFASVNDLEPAIEVLRHKEGVRRLLESAEQIKALVNQYPDGDLEKVQAKAQELIFSATQNTEAEEDAKSLLEVLNKCYIRLVERRQGVEDVYGLSVRFPSIDGMTTGFKKKDLIILAARPSMGKTALAMNMAVNVAKRNIPVLIFSLEMDDEQIGDRIVLGEFFRYKQEGDFEITSSEYQTKLSDQQFLRAQQVFNELYQLPITIVDKRGLTCAEIRAKARKIKAMTPDLGLIVIDYLQLIKPPEHGQRSWALLIGEIVRELRDLAGELDVPIILLSQLNRGVESRENKRPLMSDLRDSGNIEEFADIVMFLYREDYYYPEQAKQNGTEGVVEVIFAKQRRGPTGTVKLRFIREYTRFIDEFNQN